MSHANQLQHTMKKISHFLLIFCLTTMISLSGLTQSATGRIKGTVLTEDDKPAVGVTVQMVGTGLSAVASGSGAFSFSRLPAGDYTLRVSLVGHGNVDEKVTLGVDATEEVVLRLSVSALNLEEVIVSSYRNRLNNNTASVTLRTQTPLLQLSQNVQVVTSKALADQQIISMSDGLIRNVSGATRLEHWGDLYTNITARGSQIQAFRNGFNVVASYWGPLTEDMSFVDRIEFVKGPAGFMLANGDPSGLYNVVTKKPTGVSKGEVNVTLGSFDLYRTSLDLDGALSKDRKLLYRLNVAAQNKGSHRDYEHNNRYVIAPVVSYQLDDKSRLTLEYNGQFAKMTDVGSYYVFSRKGYGVFPRNFTYSNPGLAPTTINDHSAYVTFEHSFDDNWKATAQASYFNYSQRGSSMWPSALAASGDSIVRSVGIWDAKSTMALAQVFLNGKFETGAVNHRILAGVDVANKKYNADWGQSHALDIGFGFDPYHPNYGIPPNGYPAFDRSRSIEERSVLAWGIQTQRYASAYLQDELGFMNDRLRLTLAGRYTDVSQVYGVGVEYSSAKHFTPRVGLSFAIDPTFSAYGLYDQAFVPQTGIRYDREKIDPITGNNWELGLKKNWFANRWSTTLSVYRILKKNELTADPFHSDPGVSYSMVLGEKVARGVEFDARGTIARGFTVIANYAFTESVVSKVAGGLESAYAVGQIVPGYAKHTANAWLNYELQKGALKGLGFTGGFTSLIGRYTGWTTTGASLPDYFKLDGGISYAKNKYRVVLNVFNILDEYLYSGSYQELPTIPGDYGSSAAAYYYQTEPPRNLRLSISYSF